MHSAQAEISCDEQDNDDSADEPDDSVHDSTPLPALKSTKRVRLAHCILARPTLYARRPSLYALANMERSLPCRHLPGQMPGRRVKMPREQPGMSLPAIKLDPQ
jgi:hypothetical protein